MKKILGALAVVAVVAAIGGGVFFYATMTGMLSGVSAEVTLGEPLPGFELADHGGEMHTLEQYRGEIVVLDFCSHLCPWSVGADEVLAQLHAEYSDRGVVFLGVDSHHAVTPEEIAGYVEESGKPYPILKDAGHAYADRIGAVVTPEIFVLDREGRLAYHGAVDDRVGPAGGGGRVYLREALDALLAGEPVSNPRVRAWGCTIKRG